MEEFKLDMFAMFHCNIIHNSLFYKKMMAQKPLFKPNKVE